MARVIYIFHWKGLGKDRIKERPISCSNKRLLAERTGLGYENLVRIFTRQGRSYWEDSEHFIVKIYESDIIRGKQNLSIRGRGGIRFRGTVPTQG
jgi:hypothetical protein